MSLIINGMSLPKHSAVNGEKDTAYRCVILAHSDNTVELVIDTEFASSYDNGHNVQRFSLTKIPTPHGRLIDADKLEREHIEAERGRYGNQFYVGNNRFMQRFDNAPTVIEAEVSE